MSRIRSTVTFILMLPTLLLGSVFIAAGATAGFDEAIDRLLNDPFGLLAIVFPFLEDEDTVVQEDVLWTRIYERAVLDMGKYETRGEWNAGRTTFGVRQTMRMTATVSVTMGVNLSNIEREDVVVDDEEQTVTIIMPAAQPVECFLSDIVYSDRSCLGACGELEQDLVQAAEQDVYESEELDVALIDAFERSKSTVSAFIAPLAEDYIIIFVQDDAAPPPVEGSSCR